MAVKGEGKLASRVPLALAWTAVGVVVLALLPRAFVQNGLDLPVSVFLTALLALPLLLQGPFSLALPRQKAELLQFLARCGPETEILSSKPFTLLSYLLEIKTVDKGIEHRFKYGYAPFRLRAAPHIMMTWPTTRKGISYQNQIRFNNFSKKFNTMEFSYLRNWAVRLYAYPVKDDFWWFDLYLFRGKKATQNHLWECYQIALETKDKLTRPNPAF